MIRAAETQKKIVSNYKLVDTIFDICEACGNQEDMSVPQGAFAVKKIRKNMERHEDQFFLEGKPGASRYNSKYMNSIWGMYNRFSVHNLKKIMDDNHVNIGHTAKGLAVSSNLSVSTERLSYLPM